MKWGGIVSFRYMVSSSKNDLRIAGDRLENKIGYVSEITNFGSGWGGFSWGNWNTDRDKNTNWGSWDNNKNQSWGNWNDKDK